MMHKAIQFIILIINYYSIGFSSGFYEKFEEYKNQPLSKNINYFTLQNTIKNKY